MGSAERAGAGSGHRPQPSPPAGLRTAADLAVREIPRARPDSSAGEARAALVGHSFAAATEIAVCDGPRFIGLVALERLLQAPAETPLRKLVDGNAPIVAPDVDKEA